MREHGDILKPLIRIGDGADECWIWLGKINKRTGYGQKSFGGKSVLAHRWVYQLFAGWIPDDKVINHLCSNRCCVNPRHLEVTTQTENTRHGKGTKLKPEQVEAIRNLLKSSKWGDRKKIAEQFGVSTALISDIRYGRAWVN